MLTKNQLIVLYGMRTLDYEKDPNPEHWRTISGAKVHLDNNGEIDGGAGGKFTGNYWDGKKGQQHVVGPHTMMKKNIGSGATNVMLAAGGFLGNALGKTGTTPAKEPQKQPPKTENKDFVFPAILPKTEPRDTRYIIGADRLLKSSIKWISLYGDSDSNSQLKLKAVASIFEVPENELATPSTTEEIEAQFGSAFARANNDREKPFGKSDIKKFQTALENLKNADPTDRETVLRGINLKTLGKDSGATYREWLRAANALKGNEKTEETTKTKSTGFSSDDILKDAQNPGKEKQSNEIAAKYINSLPNPVPSTKNLFYELGNVGRSVGARVNISHSGEDGYMVPRWTSDGKYIGEIRYPIIAKRKAGTWAFSESISTFIHENMHTLDFMLGGGVSMVNGSRVNKQYSLHTPEGQILAGVVDKYARSNTTDEAKPNTEVFNFFKEYRKAKQDARAAWKQQNKAAIDQAEKDKNQLFSDYWKGKVTKSQFNSEKSRLNKIINDESGVALDKKYDGAGNLMDMYDALSAGQFHDRGCDGMLFAGHGIQYFYGGQQGNRNTELIANWGVLKMVNPNLAEMFRKDKPDVANALDKLESAMLKKAQGLKAS